MDDLDEIRPRVAWEGLPGAYYDREDIYRREVENIWQAAWLFACPACEIPVPGDYLTVALDETSVLVLHGDDGQIRAFHNVCPHRGTLLCDESHGRTGKLLVCPYHQWCFTRAGQLQSCRGMGDAGSLAGGLHKIHTLSIAGLVFVCLAETPPDVAPLIHTLGAAEPHGFANAKVAHALDYCVSANWKTVWENNRECYHCDAGHPQYIRANFDIAEAEHASPEVRAEFESILAQATVYWESEGLSVASATGGLARFPDPNDPNPFPVSATRTVQVEGYETESIDGKRVAPWLGSIRSAQAGVLRLRSLPSFWCHTSCDHAVLTRVLPAGRRQTRIRVTWLVDRLAQDGIDYSLDRLTPFWQLTSEQDWRLCERAARGIASPAFRPGPLSPAREYNLEAFFTWYLARLGLPDRARCVPTIRMKGEGAGT